MAPTLEELIQALCLDINPVEISHASMALLPFLSPTSTTTTVTASE